jgi:hypothetical protein
MVVPTAATAGSALVAAMVGGGAEEAQRELRKVVARSAWAEEIRR